MPDQKITELISTALEEDIRTGDITTEATIPPGLKASADFLVKDNGIIAGLDIAKEVFLQLDPEILFSPYFNDGSPVNRGDIAATVKGKAASILKGERTALNFLQRMSGIATLSKQYSDLVKHTKADILDTRKTVPGLRLLDKMAVASGGCKNHRIGLYDMFLIKDNHIEAAGSITGAIEGCKKYRQQFNKDFRIEVETKNMTEVSEALNANPDIIMLDNFSLEDMRSAVEYINGKCIIEVSGGVNLKTVKDIAETGVDYISVGALTHSVNALDISLEIRL